MMNEEATRLHARDTVARSASGLDAKGQLSSAYDLSLIARAGLALPDFRVYVKTIRSSFSAPHKKKYEIYTHNHLLLNYKGTFGVKNGYTVRAKASFVGAAERNGRRLVVSLMHGEPLLWKDAARLLDWGFAYAGAVSPVGRLVDPEVTPLLDDGSGHAARTSALTRQTKSSGFGVPLAPLAAAVGILVVLTGLRLRARRRRGLRLRSRSKFSLPPI
jgi:D-alanyl-D-alanine carboxypeptidase (penicillin-binding protein 5/6)